MNTRLLAIAVTSAWVLESHAVEVVLNPVQDATLYESATGSLAGGADDSLFVGATAASSLRRALVQFDVAATVPSGAVVDSVSFGLTFDKGGGPSPVTVELFRVTSSWTEGSAVPPGEGGGGTAATAGSATWLHRSFNTSLWDNPGGDFVGTASGSMIVSSLGPVVASSAGLAADAQSWLDNPSENFGWILIGGEGTASSSMRFGSSESASQPTLTINYSIVPEPATGVLALLGAGALFAARRRQ